MPYNTHITKKILQMKYKVTLWVAGTNFIFECYASNLDEAKKVAMAQHPNARIIHATATFL